MPVEIQIIEKEGDEMVFVGKIKHLEIYHHLDVEGVSKMWKGNSKAFSASLSYGFSKSFDKLNEIIGGETHVPGRAASRIFLGNALSKKSLGRLANSKSFSSRPILERKLSVANAEFDQNTEFASVYASYIGYDQKLTAIKNSSKVDKKIKKLDYSFRFFYLVLFLFIGASVIRAALSAYNTYNIDSYNFADNFADDVMSIHHSLVSAIENNLINQGEKVAGTCLWNSELTSNVKPYCPFVNISNITSPEKIINSMSYLNSKLVAANNDLKNDFQKFANPEDDLDQYLAVIRKLNVYNIPSQPNLAIFGEVDSFPGIITLIRNVKIIQIN